MDAFSLYCFILVIIQLFYCALVGDFPRNSFLSGIFATAGAMIINSFNLNFIISMFKEIIKS